MFGIIEIFHIVLATLVVSYIFSGLVRVSNKELFVVKGFDWQDYKFSLLVAAPGIILHELAHKFTAFGFGLTSYFQVWPFGLAVGTILKLLGSGFILLAPGYVVTMGADSLQGSIIAFAGPLLNLVLFFAAFLIVKYKKNLSRNAALFWVYTREINKWLFIFNILPIPPLDGYKAYGHFLF